MDRGLNIASISPPLLDLGDLHLIDAGVLLESALPRFFEGVLNISRLDDNHEHVSLLMLVFLGKDSRIVAKDV